jgi:hypothetical protein
MSHGRRSDETRGASLQPPTTQAAAGTTDAP